MGEFLILSYEKNEACILIVYRVVGCTLLAPHTVLFRVACRVFKELSVDHCGILRTFEVKQVLGPGAAV